MTIPLKKSDEPRPNIRLLLALRRCRVKGYELAELVGVGPAHISLLLNGRRRGSPGLRRRIAKALEEKVPELFEEDGANG